MLETEMSWPTIRALSLIGFKTCGPHLLAHGGGGGGECLALKGRWTVVLLRPEARFWLAGKGEGGGGRAGGPHKRAVPGLCY